MSIFLTLASLFFVGSVLGWVLELLFRNIVQKNKKWVNPGFCTGPYLPIYGFGLCTLYLLASLEKYGMIPNPLLNKLVLFAAMAVGMTLIEYAAGLFCLKYFKVMLWDYSDQWGNILGGAGGGVLLFDSPLYSGRPGLAGPESCFLLLHRNVLRRVYHRCMPLRQSGGQAQGSG